MASVALSWRTILPSTSQVSMSGCQSIWTGASVSTYLPIENKG